MKYLAKSRWALVALIVLSLAACKGGEGPCKTCSPTVPPVCTFTAPSTIEFPANAPEVKFDLTRQGSGCTCDAVSSDSSWAQPTISGLTVTVKKTSPTTANDRVAVISHCGGKTTVIDKGVPQPAACKYTPIPARSAFKNCEVGATADPVSVIVEGGNCPFQPQIIQGADWFDLMSCGGGSCNSFTPRAIKRNDTGAERTGKVKISNECIVDVVQPACPTTPTCVFQAEGSKNFSCDAQTATYTFDTNKPWSISDITGVTFVGPTSGDGNGVETVSFTLTSNKASNAVFRNVGTFKVNGSCGSSVIVTIGQYACPVDNPPPPPPINGSCAATHYGCTLGTSTNPVDGSTQWTWTCLGSNGGSNASCSENKPPTPVNGSCAATHYGCTLGTSTNPVDGSTQWTWTCLGSNGGSNASCSENKPVQQSCKIKVVQFIDVPAGGYSSRAMSINIEEVGIPESQCAWRVEIPSSLWWMEPISSISGSGNGSFNYKVPAHQGAPRTDKFRVLDVTFGKGSAEVTITQAGTTN